MNKNKLIISMGFAGYIVIAFSLITKIDISFVGFLLYLITIGLNVWDVFK